MAAQVLIADDDKDIATAIQVNLELDGFDVHIARNGLEAIEQARAIRPDVILLDILMPGLDGYRVLQMLREDPRTRSCRVIFLTAKGATAADMLAREGGAVGYIVKPFGPADLVARVRAAAEAVPPE